MKQLIEKYLRFINLERGLSINTILSYEIDLKQFSDFCAEKNILSIEELNQKIISDYLTLLSKVGLTAKSIARKISSLKNFSNYLIESGVAKKNPLELIDTPKLPKIIPTVLTFDEVNSILNSVKPSNNPLLPMNLRDRAILETLYATGIRISELINLTTKDIFFEEEIIRVFGKGDKERIVPIGKPAIEAIKKYSIQVRIQILRKKNPTDILFLNFHGKRFSRMGIWNIVNEAVKKSGIEQKIHPHTFRHTFATHLIEGGADLRSVQEMLGHAKITTTEIYTHIDRSMLKVEHQKYHPRG